MPISKDSKRPLSPHLQVYRLPYNALMSIIGRAVGAGLAVAVTVVFIWLIAVIWEPSLFEPTMDFLHLPLIAYKLIAAAFILFFYLGNGVRHVLWDFVIGVHHDSGKMTGHFVLVVSVLLTVGLLIANIEFPAETIEVSP